MKIVWLFPPARKGEFQNISQYRFTKRMKPNPFTKKSPSIIYPYLAAMGVTQLSRAGHDVAFMDCPTMNYSRLDVIRKIQAADLCILEARTPQMPLIWKICQDLRGYNPNLLIALYGDHVTWNPQESLPYADYIVTGGNFDVGILYLVEAINGGIIEKNSVLASPSLPILDKLPFCDREIVSWKPYYEAWKHREKFFWTMSQRGCYYHCIFCAWAGTFWGNCINYRSPENVAQEYQALYEQYGDCEILDDADCFDTGWGQGLAKAMISRDLDEKQIVWAIQTHPNMIISLDEMKLMHKAGLRTVKLGVESLNQITLNKIRKGTTVGQIERAFKILKEAQIMVHANMILGYPWETKQEAYHSIEQLKKLDPNQAQFSLLIPYPNTVLYDIARANHWLNVKEGDWEHYDASKPMLKMEGLTNEEIIQLYRDSWAGFYLNRAYILKHLKGLRHWEGVKQLSRGFISVYFGHMKAMD